MALMNNSAMPKAGSDVGQVNRYRDNHELKYSLRSIFKYAPWIRRIYIVTADQLPSWIDMSHPRLEMVTHEDIFPNKSHLPTFSSPAIETHLHNIKGLSRRFIYFNDDVMLGHETWPEDFWTEEEGQKIYLAWDVPRCNRGCTDSWIGDKQCDVNCNVSRCLWDLGDCANATTASTLSVRLPECRIIKVHGFLLLHGCLDVDRRQGVRQKCDNRLRLRRGAVVWPKHGNKLKGLRCF